MLALTVGDPGGIGLDVTIRAWQVRKQEGLSPFYLIADPDSVRARARLLGCDVPIKETDPRAADQHFGKALPVVPLGNKLSCSAGFPETGNAAGIVESIDRAIADVMSGDAAAMVTCPIAKKPLYDAGFRFPGHTEYLGHVGEKYVEHALTPVMMLAGPNLRAVPVTVHIPLADVPAQLTEDMIVSVAQIAAQALQDRFAIRAPRLAVAGLNPHAGEGGAIGHEDIAIIQPAIERLQACGIDARGPLPADTMFHPAALASYDTAICMYHDQALIPAKALAFDETVNVTLGLPFIRTSPDHGTAFDIAGSGKANPASLIAAIRLAAQLGEKAEMQNT